MNDYFVVWFLKKLVYSKVPDEIVDYSRQLYTYNSTIVVDWSGVPFTSKNAFIYTWMEHGYHKGSIEIASAVLDYLLKTFDPSTPLLDCTSI